MKTKHLISTSLAALLLAGSPLAVHATTTSEKDSTSVSVETKGGPSESDLANMSKEGLLAMRSVFAARSAINDGQYGEAKKMLKTAQDALGQVAEADKPTSVKDEVKEGGKVVDSTKVDVKSDLIPISGQFQILQDYAPTPEKTEHMSKAQEHIKKGDTQSAMDELKLADVGLVFQRIDMPLAATRDHVDAAMSFLNDSKYHDANMALKAAEDGLQSNTVAILAPVAPKQAPNG